MKRATTIPAAPPPAPDDAILRVPDVLARLNIGRTTLHMMIRRGEFPRPLQLSRTAVGWRRSDINRWIADRVNLSGERA